MQKTIAVLIGTALLGCSTLPKPQSIRISHYLVQLSGSELQDSGEIEAAVGSSDYDKLMDAIEFAEQFMEDDLREQTR